MKNNSTLTLGLTILVGSSAWAAVGGDSSPRLTFDQLRTACTNPERFHNQVAPKNLEISCSDVQYRWVPTDSKSIPLSVSRWVTSSIISDKYTVSPSTKEIAMTQETAACPQFKKVKEEFSLNRSLTCEEVIDYKGEANDFCVDLLEDLRASNPGAVQSTDTDETISLCDNAPAPEGRGQRGQRGQRGDIEDTRGQRGQRGQQGDSRAQQDDSRAQQSGN